MKEFMIPEDKLRNEIRDYHLARGDREAELVRPVNLVLLVRVVDTDGNEKSVLDSYDPYRTTGDFGITEIRREDREIEIPMVKHYYNLGVGNNWDPEIRTETEDSWDDEDYWDDEEDDEEDYDGDWDDD